MTPYFLAFGSFLVLYFTMEATAGTRVLASSERWALLLPLFIFALIYVGHIGSDAESYANLFDTSQGLSIEPGFSGLMTAARSIGLGYVGFTKVLAVIQVMLLASILKRLRDPLFFILFYVSCFFLNFQFNEIRNSLALLLIGAIYVRLRRPSVTALFSSSVIHYSSVLTLGLQQLADSKRQVLAISLLLFAAAFFSVVWLHPELAGDQFGGLFLYRGYLEMDFETKAIYPALILKLIVVWLFYRNGGNRFYFVAYAILVLMVHLVSPILSRLSDLVLFLALLDFCMRHQLKHNRLAAVWLALALIVSSLLIPWNDCREGGVSNWCISGPYE